MPLPLVQETKALLQEAQEWGMWTWASETNKDRVRSGIESASEALAREVEKAKRSWSKALQQVYEGAEADQRARKLRGAEDEMNRATAQSKAMFAEAERQLDAGRARQGAAEALRAIELHETVLELARRLAD